MRKIILALMCMLLTAGAAMAQKKFTFGPKVGVDLTHFWGSGTKFYESNRVQLNYQVGVFAALILVHRWVLMFIVKHEVSGKIQKTNTTSTIGRNIPTPLTLDLDSVLPIILPATCLFRLDTPWA